MSHAVCLASLLFALCMGQLTAAPNVLFISLDDLNDWIGCLGGHPQTLTPNLDQLANRGVLFNNAHCPGAACNPSRTAVLSGRSPHRSGLYANGQNMRQVLPKANLLPQHFRNHGYWAGGSGKLLHYVIDARSWDVYFPDKTKENPFPPTHYPKSRPVSIPRAGPWQYVETDWAALNVTDEEFGGDWLVSQWVGDQLKAKHTKPFFLGCGIYRPHEPWFVPKKYFEPFPLEDIQLPPGYLADDLDDLPPDGKRRGPNRYFAHIQSHDQWRPAIQAYLASIHFADAMLGRVLDALDAGPHKDNTILALWSDHGWHLGEKQHWQKYTAWRAVTRVPLMLVVPPGCSEALPAGTVAGSVCKQPVDLLSLAPTLAQLAGLPADPTWDGHNLLPLLDDSNAEWPHVALTYLADPGSYGLSAERYRYIHYAKGDEELYDIQADPHEWTNLATDSKHAAELARLRALGPSTFAPMPASGPPRPTVVLHNMRKESLRVSWLPDSGPPRLSANLIPPGQTSQRVSTIGHRFRIEGDSTDFSKTIQVTKQHEDVFIDEGPHFTTNTAPNILLILGDDWSWPHAGTLGDTVARTPTFDRIAREGVLFEHAFVQAPSCTPSRFALLSGQAPWRLKDGVNLGGSLQRKLAVYPDLLGANGFVTGYCRKGAGPSPHSHRQNDPCGTQVNDFTTFLAQRSESAPFCFWYGAGEPHRPYEWQPGRASDLPASEFKVPDFLPDNEITRADLSGYYLRVNRLDEFAGRLLAQLEENGELENTIVIMTGDNGMPFPRAKARLYDAGTRVPLAIRWGKRIPPGRTISDFVTLTDLAPTLLDAVGVDIPAAMTGRSLLPSLLSTKSGWIESDRDQVVLARERHVHAWPARAIRSRDALYIRNMDPAAWPTGEVDEPLPVYDFHKTPWPTGAPAFSFITDPSPTKQWMQQHPEHPLTQLAFGPTPEEELYDLQTDPDQLVNLAGRPDYAQQKAALAKQLKQALRKSADPRARDL